MTEPPHRGGLDRRPLHPLGVREEVHDLAVQHPGGGRVDPDPVPGVVDGQVAGHRLHRGLGRPAGQVVGHDELAAAQRGEVDDAAPAPPRHQRGGALGAREAALEVGVEGPVDQLVGDLAARHQGTVGGVVDQDVEAAEALLDLVEHPVDLAPDGDRRPDDVRLAAGPLDLLGGLPGGPGRVQVIDDDERAVGGETLGDDLADVTRPAGDQGDLSPQLLGPAHADPPEAMIRSAILPRVL